MGDSARFSRAGSVQFLNIAGSQRVNGGSPCVTAVRTEGGGEGGGSQIFSQPVPIRGGLVT